MDLYNLSPYIRVASDQILHPPWRLSERVIFDYELIFVKSGKILVTIDKQKYFGEPGDIFLIKPMQTHSIIPRDDKDFHQPHIHFDLFYQKDSPEIKVIFKPLHQIPKSEMKYFRKDITSGPDLYLPNHIRLQKPVVFENLLLEIIKEYDKKIPYYEIDIKGLFIQLWTILLRDNYWKNNPQVLSNMDLMFNIKDYLEHHIHRNVTLYELENYAHFSKYYLLKIFKDTFGMSPIRYQHFFRIKKAKEMIQFTQNTLTEIARQFGYQSIHSFSRAFKSIEGVPPTFYRQ